jgi:glycosyltransferase involved in cell wall biosynthesis
MSVCTRIAGRALVTRLNPRRTAGGWARTSTWAIIASVMARPLRIAVIEPDPLGGLLHYATQLADGLAAAGSDVTLIAARDNELADHRGPARRRLVLPPDPAPPPAEPSATEMTLRRARTARRLVTTWWRITREVRAGGYDIVVLDGSFDMALTAAAGLILMSVKGRTPVAHVCHDVRPFNRWGGDNLYIDSGPTIALLRRLYPRFDVVFVHGDLSRLEFERSWPSTRLAVVPHGDESLFVDEPPPPTVEARILFFGRWSKTKGLRVLMDAFDLLIQRRPEARLTIAGSPVPGEGEAPLVRRWAAGRAEHVELLDGYLPVEDVPDLFGRARVVVLPYLTIYQSGVLHLAMTMQRAVVVSDVGELPSVVSDGGGGLVVPSRDPHALADALERVITDPSLANRMGEAGRRRVEQGASWSSVADQFETVLRPLTSRP